MSDKFPVWPVGRAMKTTTERLQNAVGLDKLALLASEIDSLKRIVSDNQNTESLDELIETIEVEYLAQKYRISLDTFRDKIRSVMGYGAVFRLGKAWVIRKTTFLSYLQELENTERS